MRVTRELRDFTAFAGKGQLKRIKAGLKKNPELALDYQPMMEAARMGQPAVIKALLENGADVNVNSGGREVFRPLHCAIVRRAGVARSEGHREVVQLLLDEGADLDTRAIWYKATPLATAAITGQQDMVDLLLEYLGELDIFSASVTGQLNMVQNLLNKEPSLAQAVDDHNSMQPLHYCAASKLGDGNPVISGQLEAIVKVLVEHGADVNALARVTHEFYPVTWAHLAGNLAVGKALVKLGGDPRIGLKLAIDLKDEVWFNDLVKSGIDVNGRDEGGDTPLLNKLRGGTSHSQIQFLLEHEADPNLKSEKEGWTALHLAVFHDRNDQIIQSLINHGAQVDCCDKAGNTPLHIALSGNRKGATRILRHHGGID